MTDPLCRCGHEPHTGPCACGCADYRPRRSSTRRKAPKLVQVKTNGPPLHIARGTSAAELTISAIATRLGLMAAEIAAMAKALGSVHASSLTSSGPSARRELSKAVQGHAADLAAALPDSRIIVGPAIATDVASTGFDPNGVAHVLEQDPAREPRRNALLDNATTRIVGRPISDKTAHRLAKLMTNESEQAPTIGEDKVLRAVAERADRGITRRALVVLTGYKRRTCQEYVARLLRRGFVFVRADDRLLVTEAGVRELGPGFVALPADPTTLRTHWIERLPEGESAMLEALVGQYPDALTTGSLEQRLGFARRTVQQYVQRLKRRELVRIVARGLVAASHELFDGGCS